MMLNNKKFGTFAGVYTPSVLTILGVIMYMRLGWLVGQAGLIAMIIIILLSHIVSVTTGLSISSIATDKKIKVGGIYYILSRSLGLPMGGAIGIALTIGTALSISMYIVGFAESFLSIKEISEFFNLEPGIRSYRIVGSATLVILTVIALISTSLAIKTQYFILAAIGLSLVSIFAGFGIHTELHPDSPVLSAAKNGVPLETVFAIFFPAVTGFTAGVAMSGDLKDPKKNIPLGTLLAIATGFVVYISLTIGFAFFVKQDILISDTNIASHVAWIPSLVVAGIWGATLSSALGGILGGPRILQALASDRIMPKFFAKGYGQTNEPRNALLLIYLIAEGGILVGDLNAIAGVVTMFYLTSYGFINLAYVLESWASTDFRPSFKVSRIFGIIGFVFAFALMFKLDMISMIIAFVIIGLIYFFLQRKQLKSDSGDVWLSVWISIIRRGLAVLSTKQIEDRNWQPNIILFTGGSKQRPHLLEFGKSLVGRYGLLTNFDLIVDKNAEVLFPKHKQAYIDRENASEGVFFRRQSCKDIYDGIEMICRTYGFSGLEPNTVIMGWARQSKNPERFVKLIEIINSLDYNLILIDYDKRYGFGKYKQIDIWWRGAGNNGNFALTLAKFMKTSQQWENATIRLMIVNDDDSKAFYLFRRAKEILTNMRIDAEVKIINNEIEQKPFYDIIREQSKTADIVFLGIPQVLKGEEKEFVKRTNALLFEIGTVALIKASSLFKELNLGVNLFQKPVISVHETSLKPEILSEKLYVSKHHELNMQFKRNLENILSLYEKTIQTYIFRQIDEFSIIINDFENIFRSVMRVLSANIQKIENQLDRAKYVLKFQNYLLKKFGTYISEFKKEKLPPLTELAAEVVADYVKLQKEFLDTIQNDIVLYFPKSDLQPKPGDSSALKMFKISLLLKHKGKDPVPVKITAKERKKVLVPRFYEILFLDTEQIRIESLRFIYNFEQFFIEIIEKFDALKQAQPDELQAILSKIDDFFGEKMKNLQQINLKIPARLSAHRKTLLINALNDLLKNSEKIEKLYEIKTVKQNKKDLAKFLQRIDNELNIFFLTLDKYLNLINYQNSLKTFNLNLEIYAKEFKRNLLQTEEKISINQFTDIFLTFAKKIEKILNLLPSQIEVIDSNSLNDSLYKDFKTLNTHTINLKQKLGSYFRKNIEEPVWKLVSRTSVVDSGLKNRILSILKQALKNMPKV